MQTLMPSNNPYLLNCLCGLKQAQYLHGGSAIARCTAFCLNLSILHSSISHLFSSFRYLNLAGCQELACLSIAKHYRHIPFPLLAQICNDTYLCLQHDPQLHSYNPRSKIAACYMHRSRFPLLVLVFPYLQPQSFSWISAFLNHRHIYPLLFVALSIPIQAF